MTKYEDECCGPCPMGCVGCSNRHAPRYYCDECEGRADVLFTNGDEDICEGCLWEHWKNVDIYDVAEYFGYHRKVD